MFGWSQAIHANREPSGDKRGKAKNWLPPTTTRTFDASSAADPSSGTATIARRTSPSAVCSSRTHHTSSRAATWVSSAYRQPASTCETGVSGVGDDPTSSRYSRWSPHSANTSADADSGSHAMPPYSCTRVRAFHGAGSRSPRPADTTTCRPPSLGRPSVHHTSSAPSASRTTATKPSRTPPRATSAALMGEGQEP